MCSYKSSVAFLSSKEKFLRTALCNKTLLKRNLKKCMLCTTWY